MNLAVIDPGVFVAGVFWRHEPHLCLKAWLRGMMTPVMTEDMLAELKLFAGAKKESISEVVREAVSSFLKQNNAQPKNWTSDSIWDMVGTANSEISDGALNHDFYLYGKSK